jgi:hypothetical protein
VPTHDVHDLLRTPLVEPGARVVVDVVAEVKGGGREAGFCLFLECGETGVLREAGEGLASAFGQASKER